MRAVALRKLMTHLSGAASAWLLPVQGRGYTYEFELTAVANIGSTTVRALVSTFALHARLRVAFRVLLAVHVRIRTHTHIQHAHTAHTVHTQVCAVCLLHLLWWRGVLLLPRPLRSPCRYHAELPLDVTDDEAPLAIT